MNSNLIPKSLTKQRLKIFRNFTFYDLGLSICYFFVALGIACLIPFVSNPAKVIIGVTLFFFLNLSLLNNRYYHLKNYQIVTHGVNFLLQKKVYSDENDDKNDTSLLVPYKQIVNNFIETEPLEGGLKWYIGAIEIKGFNISTLTYEEQQLRIIQLQDVFKYLDCSVSLIKIDKPIDYNNHINELGYLEDKLIKLHEAGKLSDKGLQNRIYQLQGYFENYFTHEDLNQIATCKKFYLFIYHKNVQELKKIIKLAETKLFGANLQPLPCDKYQLVNTIRSLFNPYSQDFSEEAIDQFSTDLKSLLKFTNIKFYKDCFKVNNTYYTVNGIHDYPTIPKNGWGAYLAQPSSTMIWNISSTNFDEVKEQLHRAIINASTNILSTKKIVDKSQENYQIDAFNSLVDKLTTGEEVIKKCNILFLTYGQDSKNLKANQSQLIQVLKENNFTIDYLNFRQKQGLSALLPKPTDPLHNKFGREIPSFTLAASFPFMNNELNDERGLFMGFNITGDLIMFNQFHQDYHRKNFNQLLLGTSGSGKSHTAKKQLNWHVANGRKVIVIDPEREYKNLCNFHDGKWVDVGNGSEGKLNPLQILSSWDENETADIIIANHLQTLEHWFSIIIPDLNANESRYLIQKIAQLYKKFNINDKVISDLKPHDYPIFDDLVMLLKDLQTTNSEYNKVLDIISLEFTGNGKYAQLYNGYSSIELNSNLLTVYDINSLFEKGNNKIIQAQLFLILAYIQNEVKITSFNNENEIIILVDEAHLIIDKDNPAGLNFMFQMVKRIRKRRGGIILITQNPDDFLGSNEIKKKTTAIINNTQYSFILNLSPQNLTDIKDLFKAYGGLSVEETNFIAKAKRGQALFVVSGFNRHCLQIELSATEIQAFNNEEQN